MGRDILIGCTAMCASVVLVGVVHWLARSALGLHWMPSIPPPSRLEILLSPRHLGSAFCDAIFNGIYSALAVLAALLVLFVILRKAWLAVGVMWLCATTFSWLYFGDRSVATFVFFAVWMSIFILVALRFGLLAYAACVFTFHAMVYIPVTIQDTWYAYLGWGGQLLIALLAAYGFYTSLAGQPIIADPFGYRRMHSSNATGSFGAGTSS